MGGDLVLSCLDGGYKDKSHFEFVIDEHPVDHERSARVKGQPSRESHNARAHSIPMKTPALVLLATTIARSAAAATPPRPAVKPMLKLRGGALVQWPALYNEDVTDKVSDRDLTLAGNMMMSVVIVAGLFGLHAISFQDLLPRLPGMGRLAFFIFAAFAVDLWPKRTFGWLVTDALSHSTFMYATAGLNWSLAFLAVGLVGGGIGQARRRTQRWIKVNIRGPFSSLFRVLVFLFLVSGSLSCLSLACRLHVCHHDERIQHAG